MAFSKTPTLAWVLLFLQACEAFVGISNPKGVGCSRFPHVDPAGRPSTPNRQIASRVAATECREGILEVQRTLSSSEEEDQKDELYNISYKVFRPMTLSSRQASPLVVLHGGPSVPSDYLQPLVDVVPYRSIIFYDQLGCGKSDEPKDVSAYSVDKGVDDLELLVKKLGLKQFHLLGQSFGGILAYEFAERIAEKYPDDKRFPEDTYNNQSPFEILSVILASSPTSIPLVEAEVQGLLDKLTEVDDLVYVELEATDAEALFQSKHICRTKEKPQALLDAYAHAGTVWRGTQAIPDYEAEPPSEPAAPLPPVMVVRGEHDFVTEACINDWKDRIWNQRRVRVKQVDGCSHHALLENGPAFGDLVDSYCTEYDP